MSKPTHQLIPAPELPVFVLPERINVSPEVLALRTTLLEECEGIIAVEGQDDVATAVSAAGKLKALSSEAQAYSKKARDPFTQMAKLIKATGDDFAATIDTEVARIERLLSDYAAEQRRKEREAQEAAARAQREAAEANRRAEEAQRREQEAKAAAERAQREADEAKGKRAKAAAEEAARKAREEAAAAERQRQQAEEEAMDAHSEAEAAATPTDAPAGPITGATTRGRLDFEVEDINALYRACPFLCKIEARRQDILDRLAMGWNETNLPGLRIFETTKVHARSNAADAAKQLR